MRFRFTQAAPAGLLTGAGWTVKHETGVTESGAEPAEASVKVTRITAMT